MNAQKLEPVANTLVRDGKGILAADESTGTITKRFGQVGVASTAETRRAYRELLCTAPGIEAWISGVILFDETIQQLTRAGDPVPAVLTKRGILPGIKVDQGTLPLSGFPNEKLTAGLDGLPERLERYRDLLAQFTKWRAVFSIGDGLPSTTCIQANAERLACYASFSQAAGLVPIVEPEVLMDGDHDLARCEEVTGAVLAAVFTRLRDYRVHLEGMLLKPNMILPGRQCPHHATVGDVASATLRCLRRVVPAAVPGVVFLSGGQTPEAATAHLNAMNAMGQQPWEVSFSFGRALQDPALAAWRGDNAKVAEAQRIFAHRAACNTAARRGEYTESMERSTADRRAA
jgi:fructose-bisphosphate aldolase, class I